MILEGMGQATIVLFKKSFETEGDSSGALYLFSSCKARFLKPVFPGDQLRFAVTYERGIGTRGHVEPRVHSATKPDFYRVYKADQVTDVVHSVVPDMRRAKAVEFNASGPNLSKIFDGKEQLVAVTSIPAYYRQIFLPR